MSVEELEAGREMDALVAEKADGWQWATLVNTAMLFPQWFWVSEQIASRPSLYRVGKVGARVDYDNYWHASSSPHLPKVPNYSTDRTEALDLLERHFTEWAVERQASGEYLATVWIGEQMFESHAPTLPLAVCRAVLKVAETAQSVCAGQS